MAEDKLEKTRSEIAKFKKSLLESCSSNIEKENGSRSSFPSKGFFSQTDKKLSEDLN